MPKNRPSIFLDKIAVVPNSKFKSAIEDLLSFDNGKTDQRIEEWVSDHVPLPRLQNQDELPKGFYVLDLLISFQTGSDVFMWSNPVLPFLWRPYINIYSHLTDENKKIICRFKTKEVLSWKHYFGRILIREISLSGVGNKKVMYFLFGQCALRLLEWLKIEIDKEARKKAA